MSISVWGVGNQYAECDKQQQQSRTRSAGLEIKEGEEFKRHYKPKKIWRQTFQISTFQKMEIDEHLEIPACPFPKFGIFGKFASLENMLLLLEPLWG